MSDAISMPRFTEEQVQRYSRHIILPNIGGRGQRKQEPQGTEGRAGGQQK